MRLIKHLPLRATVMLTALMVTLPSYQAFAEQRWNNRSDLNGRPYHNGIHRQQDEDYTTKSVTHNAAGEPITTRTHVERDKGSYTRTTTIKGPDGLISREKEDIEYDKNEVTHRTRTRNPDGTIDIDKKTYDLND